MEDLPSVLRSIWNWIVCWEWSGIGLIALLIAIWRGVVAWSQAKTSQRGLLNERYQKGVENLGGGEISVRLAGVDELQRLAEHYPKQYHVQIMRRLCDFVRHPTKDENDTAEQTGIRGQRNIKDRVKALMVPEDVQAAIEAIGTRSVAGVKLEKKKKFEPDLSGAQLSGVDLSKSKANLSGVDLSNVVFAPPDLMSLNLSCEEALELPRITAILSGADLRGAKLVEADLTDADLTGADLRGAKAITQEQLDLARAYSTDPTKVDPPLEPPRNMPYMNFVDRLASNSR